MKIQILSDLHLEFFNNFRESITNFRIIENLCKSFFTEADILIIAGDLGIFVNPNLILALDFFINHYSQVLYIPGNHEYYGTSFREAERYFSFITSMERIRTGEEFSVGNIHATTGWFTEKPDISYCYWKKIADSYSIGLDYPVEKISRDINSGWGGLYTEYQYKNEAPLHEFFHRGERAIQYLMDHVNPGDIIVTHHLPLWSSIDPNYKEDKTNYFYVNEGMRKVIEQKQPSLWIHGHTHCSNDYTVGDTRVISNPRGYPGQVNQEFNPHFIIEV